MRKPSRRARRRLAESCARLLWRTLEDFGVAHDPFAPDDAGEGTGDGARDTAPPRWHGPGESSPARPATPGAAPDAPGAATGAARRQTVVMTSSASKRGARGR